MRRGSDLRQSITAQVSVRNFTLAPPGSCTVLECGTVRFELRHGQQCWAFESAQRFTSLSTLGLPDGSYRIEAALFDTFGEAYSPDQDGERSSGEVEPLSCDDEKPTCTDCLRFFDLDPTCGEVEPEPTPEPSPDSNGPVPDAGGAGTVVDADAAANDAGPSGSASGGEAGTTPIDAGLAGDAGPGGNGVTPTRDAAPPSRAPDAAPGPGAPDAGAGAPPPGRDASSLDSGRDGAP